MFEINYEREKENAQKEKNTRTHQPQAGHLLKTYIKRI